MPKRDLQNNFIEITLQHRCCKVTPRTLTLFDTSDFTRGVYLKHQINYDTDI